MASPQLENGYINIANELGEAFFKLQLSGNEWRILWVILRQTYGWHKKTDRISITQFQQRTELKRRHVARILKDLVDRYIITKNDTTFITTYGFNKDYSQWQSLPKMTHSVKNGNETVTKIGAHKRNKENILHSSSQEKKTDPRVKTLIDYFFQTCKEVKGFKPAINGKDGQAVKRMLSTYSEDTLKSIISFFLDNKKADEVGITLSIALSAHTINLYLKEQSKSQGDKTPENYFSKL